MVKKKFPLVSVIVVTHNNNEWLEKSIPSLLSQTYNNLEVIVVDNASGRDVKSFVRKRFPKVRVVVMKENRGFGSGNNAGISAAGGDYVLVSNDDLILEKDCIEKLVAVMEEDNSIGVCQGTIYSYDERSKIESSGKYFNYSGILTGDSVKATKNSDGLVEVFAANAPFIRRSVFDEIGGFDEDFFIYFEEVDLCWRIWLAGHRVVYVPEAGMYHKGGATTSKMKESFIFFNSIRNRIASYIKNLGFPRVVVALVVQVLINLSGALVLLVRGKVKLSVAIGKAWLWNIWHLPAMSAKRRIIQKSRLISDRELFLRVGEPLSLQKLRGLFR